VASDVSGGSEGELLWLATAMDPRAVLAVFDEQIRRHPTAEAPGERVERDEAVVRFVAGEGGRSTVTWSQLDETAADAVITDTIARLRCSGWVSGSGSTTPTTAPPICRGAFWPPGSRPNRPRR
jgi:hypothetical protein